MDTKKPTIAELEKILNDPEQRDIKLLPDGSITVGLSKSEQIIALQDQLSESVLLKDVEYHIEKAAKLSKALGDMGFVGASVIGCKDCRRNMEHREIALK